MQDQIIKIAVEVLNEDELWMLRVLLLETMTEVNIEKRQATPLKSNIGLPHEDIICGPLFTGYFNKALQQLRDVMDKELINSRGINPWMIEVINTRLQRQKNKKTIIMRRNKQREEAGETSSN